MSWSEDAIHRWLLSLARPPGLAGSRGHDAAVLVELRGRPVVCTDQTIEEVHFESAADPRLVGRKAAARALSDLAATAARPRALLLALSAPGTRTERWIRGVISGARGMARACGADLVGGDLAAARGRSSISATALGELPGRATPPGRDRARAGQLVVLTGPVGGSLLGRHLRIRPRLAEGRSLFVAGATAMMDVSDGLAWDLYKLARASGVRIEVDLATVPVHRDARAMARRSGRDPLWHALHDGEDHELVATLPPRARPGLRSLWIIGRVTEGSGLWLGDPAGSLRRWRRDEGGFEHGR